jgi:hypothetical protein
MISFFSPILDPYTNLNNKSAKICFLFYIRKNKISLKSVVVIIFEYNTIIVEYLNTLWERSQ